MKTILIVINEEDTARMQFEISSKNAELPARHRRRIPASRFVVTPLAIGLHMSRARWRIGERADGATLRCLRYPRRCRWYWPIWVAGRAGTMAVPFLADGQLPRLACPRRARLGHVKLSAAASS